MTAFRSLLFLLLIVDPTSGLRAEKQSLVLISPHWEGIRFEFQRAFQIYYRRLTGHEVEFDWRDMGGASDDLRFVLSEFKKNPEGIGIDLFFGGGIDPFQEMKTHQVLEPYMPHASVLRGIPANPSFPLRDSQGHWHGAALSSFGILCNERVIQTLKLPKATTWKDLADPRLKGWIGSGDPRNSGSTHMVFECIMQAYGWEEGWTIIQGMGANIRQFDRSSGTAAKSCTLGNVAYCLVVDFYGFLQIAEGGTETMSLIIPPKESILTPDPIAILKGAPHPNVARSFVDFVLSEQGQKLWLASLGHPDGPVRFNIQRMSVRSHLYEELGPQMALKTNPFLQLTPIAYDSAKASKRWNLLNALLGVFIIDRPPEDRGRFQIPISENQCEALSQSDWSDPVKRARIQLDWQNLKPEAPGRK